MKRTWYPGLWLILAIVIGMAIIPAITGSASLRETIFTLLLAVGLASSLNILLGYTGYVSFGHIVFFGFGGYVGFYLLSVQGWHLALAVAGGGLASGALAFLLGKAILKLRGAYFALATLGINEAMRSLIINLDTFGGPLGMNLNFQIYRDYGGAAQALWTTYWAILGLVVAVVVISYLVKRSKFGLGLMAVREDQDAAEVMGVASANAKTWAFVLSAAFPGMLGVLFFFKNGNIEPVDAFPLVKSIEMIVMVMLGGQGTVLGPVLGALGYERLRGFLLTSEIFKDVHLAVAGVLLLVIVLFIPSGAVGWIRSRFHSLRGVVE